MPENQEVHHFHHHETPQMTVDFEITKYAKGGFGYTIKVKDCVDFEAAARKAQEVSQRLDKDYPTGGG